MNNFNCFLSEYLKVASFFVASGLSFVKALPIIMIVFLALNRPHNKFLQTPLYEFNCLKQITKLLIRRSRKEENN